MMLVLACALCAASPSERPTLLAEELTLEYADRSPTIRVLDLGGPTDHGSGGGDDHSGHMGPMWIVMGAMMAVMMVGMGLYFMRNADGGQALGAATLPSPSQVALPVSGRPGGG